MTKEKLKNLLNEHLLNIEDELSSHILNVTPIPNPLYMVEKNQREMKWSDNDNEVYHTLNRVRQILLKELKK